MKKICCFFFSIFVFSFFRNDGFSTSDYFFESSIVEGEVLTFLPNERDKFIGELELRIVEVLAGDRHILGNKVRVNYQFEGGADARIFFGDLRLFEGDRAVWVLDYSGENLSLNESYMNIMSSSDVLLPAVRRIVGEDYTQYLEWGRIVGELGEMQEEYRRVEVQKMELGVNKVLDRWLYFIGEMRGIDNGAGLVKNELSASDPIADDADLKNSGTPSPIDESAKEAENDNSRVRSILVFSLSGLALVSFVFAMWYQIRRH